MNDEFENRESTSETASGPSRGLPVFLAVVLALAAAGGGFGAAWYLLHEEHAGGEESSAGLWTCGMHPQVIQDEPGLCPICHMDLVPLRDPGAAQTAAGEPAGRIEVWTCPDHPSIEESEPGECPIDGRELVAREGEAASSSQSSDDANAAVRIDPAVEQNMNVRAVPAVRRKLQERVRTVGYLEYDEESMVSVTTKYSGWVEKVFVSYVGEPVRRGQPLFAIYSPELVQTEQELLSALRHARRMEGLAAGEAMRARAESLVDAARTRLSYWDVTAEQIAVLERTGEVLRTLEVAAPASGLVMKRMPGLEGMAVKPGMELFHLADLSTLWLSVEVFEDQLAWVGPGTAAGVRFSYFPGEVFRGKVRILEPQLTESTRTLRVRLALHNPQGRLRAGMFAEVIFEPPAGEEALAVPADAVLRTGTREVVVVRVAEGRYVPREVILGRQAEGWVEVLEGLDEGEMVVTSAQFMLDSESRLQQAVGRLIGEREAAHAGH